MFILRRGALEQQLQKVFNESFRGTIVVGYNFVLFLLFLRNYKPNLIISIAGLVT